MSGGGGTSGAIDFPTHMKEIHQDWLGYSGGVTAVDTDLIAVMNTALGVSGNPFDSLTYTDPATDFTAVQTIFDGWETIADALDEETDWTSFIANAKTNSDTIMDAAIAKIKDLISDEDLARVIKSYEGRKSYSRNRAITQFAGTMSDINAVQGSAFMFGMALIQAEHLAEVEDYHAKMSLQIQGQLLRDYVNIMVQQGQVMSSMQGNNVTFQQALAQTLLEIKRVKTVAEAEYVGNEADLNEKFSEWDFKVFQWGGQLLGSMGGGTALPSKPSKASSAIGGVLGGASAGAALGPVGMGVGAVLGGLSGLLG